MKIEGNHTGSNTLSAPVADSASQLRATDDATAKELSRIWQGLLVIETIDVDQNFFDFGGDSSLAVRMFSQIEQTFGVKLPLATLYEAPTIAELARILRGEISSCGWCTTGRNSTIGVPSSLYSAYMVRAALFSYSAICRSVLD